jgi:hypothetical protein
VADLVVEQHELLLLDILQHQHKLRLHKNMIEQHGLLPEIRLHIIGETDEHEHKQID